MYIWAFTVHSPSPILSISDNSKMKNIQIIQSDKYVRKATGYYYWLQQDRAKGKNPTI